MIPVVTPDEMRAIDAAATRARRRADRPGRCRGGSRGARRLLGGSYGRRVVVVAGKGNNGNDGRVAADRLRRDRRCGSVSIEAAGGVATRCLRAIS